MRFSLNRPPKSVEAPPVVIQENKRTRRSLRRAIGVVIFPIASQRQPQPFRLAV